MTDQEAQELHTERVVNDYFIVEAHIMSTRTADAYKAIEKATATTVSLWLLRHSLPVNSDAVKRFLTRLQVISKLDPPLCNVFSYGVDPIGTAFLIEPPIDGLMITKARVDVKEADRRFTTIIRMIERLHANRIVCGDLCGASFIVGREGEIRFVGGMGSFDSEATSTAMMPPAETLPFLAPEFRSGAGITAASDVFSLGVLGYYFMTGQYPYGEASLNLIADYDVAQLKSVSQYITHAPSWADEVFSTCLNPDPAGRYGSAGQLLDAIRRIQQQGLSGERLPARLTQSGASSGSRSTITGANLAVAVEKQEKPQAAQKAKRNVVTLAVFLALLAGAFAFSLFLRPDAPPKSSKLSDELAAHKFAVEDSKLREAIDVVARGKVPLAQKAAELEKMVSSDDPIAHDVLVKSAVEAGSKEERDVIEKAIIDRARRLGLVRGAEQVRQWLRTIKHGPIPESYEPVLRSLDVTLPTEGRNTTLRRAYVTNPRLSLRLGVALALDSGKLESYQPVIAQLIGDSMSMGNAKDYSALTLILAHTELSSLFGEDVIQRRSEIPDKDIEWLLKTLAQRNDSYVRPISSLAVERGTLSTIRSYFLGIIRDRSDLPPEVQEALVRASAGAARAEDIVSIGSWYDLEGEEILLSILADTYGPEVYVEAFDTLAAKSLSVDPVKTLVSWIRRGHWDNRKDFAHSIGVLGSMDKLDLATVIAALGAFDSYVEDAELIGIFIDAQSPSIVHAALDRYPKALSVGDRLNLLGHSDKAVRVAAVKALKDQKDIGVLKLIIDHYETEKDAEVKALYKETFWTIRERANQKVP